MTTPLSADGCTHDDERGSTVMETSIAGRYECAVCGTRFRLELLDATRAAPEVERLRRAYLVVHSSYDGECEHGFGPPATECPNDGCPDKELAEAWSVALGDPR